MRESRLTIDQYSNWVYIKFSDKDKNIMLEGLSRKQHQQLSKNE
jgi:hypothetical protein